MGWNWNHPEFLGMGRIETFVFFCFSFTWRLRPNYYPLIPCPGHRNSGNTSWNPPLPFVLEHLHYQVFLTYREIVYLGLKRIYARLLIPISYFFFLWKGHWSDVSGKVDAPVFNANHLLQSRFCSCPLCCIHSLNFNFWWLCYYGNKNLHHIQ